MKTISKQVCNGRQDVIFKEVLGHGDIRLKVRIKSDSYDFQSSASIKVWDAANNRWNEVHTLHYSNMQTPHSLRYRGDERAMGQHFAADRKELIRVAKLVVEPTAIK